MQRKLNIAVVGAGISGLGAAWLLSRNHQVTVFEKESRLGGHANTLVVDYGEREIPVDTGFIVYNEANYPNLCALFDRLGVATERSDMSFSVSQRRGGFEWAWDGADPSVLFAQGSNLANPPFLRMLLDVQRFRKQAVLDLHSGYLGRLSMGAYVAKRGYGPQFVDWYLVPLGSAIWSTPGDQILDFPAATLVRFFSNHHLISLKPAKWRTVTGGSREYVQRLAADMTAEIATGAGVVAVRRGEAHVEILTGDGDRRVFDHVVLATHSDQALGLLVDASEEERRLLGAVGYAPNIAYLHRDRELMPRRERAWASWNAMSTVAAAPGEEPPVFVSYWMNRLQNIDRRYPLFVTLNPPVPPREELTYAAIDYAHPQFDKAAIGAQGQLDRIQGVANTWYCGAWCGYGFHEDGLKAGLDVAERLGGFARPWAESADELVPAPYRQAAE